MDKKKLRLERATELRKRPVIEFAFLRWKAILNWAVLNKQNYRIYLPKMSAENLQLQLATRTQTLPMLMLWAAVTADGCRPLVFIDREVKINAEYYWENVLKTVLKRWADKHFNRTQHHRIQHLSSKNGLRKRFLALLLPHNGHQNLRISIRWTFAPQAF